MNIKWIIESGVFPEEVTADIEKALTANDIDFKLKLDVVEYAKTKIGMNDRCDFYIPYGSVGMIKELQDVVDRDLLPAQNFGIWHNPDQLSFGAMSANWGEYLLNYENVITTIADFKRRTQYFYDLMGEDMQGQKVLFVKPYLNNKAFNGMILMEMTAQGTLDKLIRDNNYFDRVMPETLVVISKPRVVMNEWRLFILNRRVIASTQYNRGRKKHYEEGIPVDDAGTRFVANVLSDPWQPDVAYSLDICQAEDVNYYVMEIGCLNCSDLYAASKVKFFVEMTDFFQRIT